MDKGDQLSSLFPQETCKWPRALSSRGPLVSEGNWEASSRETIAQVMGCHGAEWREAYQQRKGQENNRCPATDYVIMQKKTFVCPLLFNRSTLTARGDLYEEKLHHRPLRSQLCSGVFKVLHSQRYETCRLGGQDHGGGSMDKWSERCREVYLSGRAAKPGVGLGTTAKDSKKTSVLWVGLNSNTHLL